MAVPQGLANFGGLTSLLSARYTLTHGITPGVCTLYVPPQPDVAFTVGPLVFSYGSVEIVFPDCILDRVALEYGRDGRQIWALHILDRRWKWKFAGRISGYYNVRRDGAEIVAGSEASPRELAELCLQAMGETKYDLSAMPDGSYPEVGWEYDLPADALSRVCDAAGCRVILQLDNTVRIAPVGVGLALPTGNDILESSLEADPPERPDSLVFVAGRTRWQQNFVLEAVGRDADNQIKPINDLSYTPTLAGGARSWELADVPWYNCVDDTKYREFAKETVFRWYRIRLPNALSDGTEVSFDLDRILPIEDVQVETWMVCDREESRPAWVYGLFCSGYEGNSPFEPVVENDLTNHPQNLYSRAFTVDKELGIVKFAEPVYLLADAGGQVGHVLPAVLRLRTACSVRDAGTRGWRRHQIKRTMPGTPIGTPPKYITRDDIALQYHENFSPPGVGIINNQADVESQAEYYLDAAQREYQFNSPRSISYAGFKPISPDGAIQQVTWSISEEGFATTRASRNKEELLIVPSYKERRMIERLQVALARDEKTDRQKQADQEKARA